MLLVFEGLLVWILNLPKKISVWRRVMKELWSSPKPLGLTSGTFYCKLQLYTCKALIIYLQDYKTLALGSELQFWWKWCPWALVVVNCLVANCWAQCWDVSSSSEFSCYSMRVHALTFMQLCCWFLPGQGLRSTRCLCTCCYKRQCLD